MRPRSSGAGVRLGESYPRPIVEHGAARSWALAAYERVKNSSIARLEGSLCFRLD
jgi:deoxyribodipyrimidine photolyase